MNTEELDVDLLPDEAVISAMTPKALNDIELKPFSLLRQAIATDLCARTEIGNSNFFNVVVTVWVCTLTPKECLKARDDVELARINAFEWAEKMGYSLLKFDALTEMYKKLSDELKASTQVKVKDSDRENDIPKNDGRQLDSFK